MPTPILLSDDLPVKARPRRFRRRRSWLHACRWIGLALAAGGIATLALADPGTPAAGWSEAPALFGP